MSKNIVLVDKPVGFSSFQIVRVFRRYYSKVGHAGTLDPCASGLLIMLIGQATKRSAELQQYEKTYHGEMFLGMMTDTYDMSGRIENCTLAEVQEKECTPAPFSVTTLSAVAQSFVGNIQQEPPRYSALKRNGRKLYELSRRGVHVQPQKRSVFIRSFSITDYRYPVVSFEIVVGKGVYVRSLAHDFGQKLNCGATLLSLRRTKIGEYVVDDAADLGAALHERTL